MTLAAGGALLRYNGVMTPQVSKGLSKLSMQLTIPCLLFTTAVDCKQNWSHEPCPSLWLSLQEGWPMFLLPLVYVPVGLVVGYCAARLGQAPPNFVRSGAAAVAFGNSTGLPIVLLTCIHSQYAPDSGLGRVNPLLFLSVYLILYPVLQWSIGGALLRPRPTKPWPDPDLTNPLLEEMVQQEDADRARRAAHQDSEAHSHSRYSESATASHFGTLSEEFHKSPLFTPELPIAMVQGSSQDLAMLARMHESNDHYLPLASVHEPSSPVHANGDVSPADQLAASHCIPEQNRWADIGIALARIFPPPVIGALMGMVVALTPFARGALVDTVSRDGGAPLEWIFDGLLKLGAAAVPINMIILGNSLYKGLTPKHLAQCDSETEEADGGVSLRTHFALSIAKLVVMPCVGLLVTLGIKHMHIVDSSVDDAFYLVAMVITATPTANNIVVMAELAGESKDALAKCILVQYLLSPFLLTFWLSIFVYVAIS